MCNENYKLETDGPDKKCRCPEKDFSECDGKCHVSCQECPTVRPQWATDMLTMLLQPAAHNIHAEGAKCVCNENYVQDEGSRDGKCTCPKEGFVESGGKCKVTDPWLL